MDDLSMLEGRLLAIRKQAQELGIDLDYTQEISDSYAELTFLHEKWAEYQDEDPNKAKKKLEAEEQEIQSKLHQKGLTEAVRNNLEGQLKVIQQLLKNNLKWEETAQELASDINEQGVGAYNTAASVTQAYQTYEKLPGIIQTLNKKLQLTKDISEKQILTKGFFQQLNAFGIKIDNLTAEQQQAFETIIEGVANESEEAYKDLVVFVARAAGLSVNSIDDIVGQTREGIKGLGTDAINTVDAIRQALGGFYDNEGKLQFNWSQAVGKDDSSKSKEDKDWENPYNWLYNLNQRMNAVLRQRNQLEVEYNRLVRDNGLTAQEHLKYLNVQTDKLKELSNLEIKRAEGAEASIKAIIGSDSRLSKIVGVGENGQIAIDYELADKYFKHDPDGGAALEKAIDEIQSWIDELNDAQDKSNEFLDQIYELEHQNDESYYSLLQDFTEAYRSFRHQQIDELTNTNEIIKEFQDEVATKMQESIQEQREARDLAEKQKNLQNKAANVQYLIGSGASSLDIRKAQEELDKETQSFEDTLIDKSLKELQDANTKAAEQREKQIKIMEDQYQQWEKFLSGDQAEKILAEGLTEVYGEGFSKTPAKKIIDEYMTEKGLPSSIAKQNSEALMEKINEAASSKAFFDVVAQSGVDVDDKTTGLAATYNKVADVSKALSENENSISNRLSNLESGNSQLVEYWTQHPGITQADLDKLAIDIKSSFNGQGSGSGYGGTGGVDFETDNKKTDISMSLERLFELQERLGNDGFADLTDQKKRLAYKEITDNAIRDYELGLDDTAQALSTKQRKGKSVSQAESLYLKTYYTQASLNNKTKKTSVEQEATKPSEEKPQAAESYNRNFGGSGQMPKISLTGAKIGTSPLDATFDFNDAKSGEEEDFSLVLNDTHYDARVKGVSSKLGKAIKEVATRQGISDFNDQVIKFTDTYGSEGYYLYKDGYAFLLKKYTGWSNHSSRDLYISPNDFPSGLRYATGGIADYTGPAWLDGTPSKPELVLNQVDTQNFLQLRDILSEIMSRFRTANSSSTPQGNSYFDIKVDVDSISNDYDVDQMIARVKEQIVDAANYRNSTFISQTL